MCEILLAMDDIKKQIAELKKQQRFTTSRSEWEYYQSLIEELLVKLNEIKEK